MTLSLSRYSFPKQPYKEKKNKSGITYRGCSRELLVRHHYLGYSKILDGVYCLACKLFPVDQSKNAGTAASVLVDRPMKDWHHASTRIKEHAKTKVHKDCLIGFDNFMSVTEGSTPAIDMVIAQVNEATVKKNKAVIGELIRCLKLCVQQGIAMRASTDDGLAFLDDESPINMGNFKAIVKFSIDSGNSILAEHFSMCSKNATYVSKTAQRDMLMALLSCLQRSIVNECKLQHTDTQFIYSISADEVTDSATFEQLGLAIRYVHADGSIKERLLEYVRLSAMTGAVIAESIKNCLERHGLDVEAIRAQTYDGASNMSSGNLKKATFKLTNKVTIIILVQLLLTAI